MPRPEGAIHEENPAAELALELRRLRASAGGPSYRTLAARTNFSFSTLAKAASGRDLPTLDVALAFAAACGGDRVDIQTRWETAQRGLDKGAPEDITSRRSGSRLTAPRTPPAPRRATNTIVFVDLMRQLQRWAGLTLRQLEKRSPRTLSRSTVSDALKRDSLPRLELVEQFVIACGARRDLALWRDRWRKLNAQEARAAAWRRRPPRPGSAGHATQLRPLADVDIELVVPPNGEWSKLPEGVDVEALKADLIRSLRDRSNGGAAATDASTQTLTGPALNPPTEQNADLERELRYARAFAVLGGPVRGGSDCL